MTLSYFCAGVFLKCWHFDLTFQVKLAITTPKKGRPRECANLIIFCSRKALQSQQQLVHIQNLFALQSHICHKLTSAWLTKSSLQKNMYIAICNTWQKFWMPTELHRSMWLSPQVQLQEGTCLNKNNLKRQAGVCATSSRMCSCHTQGHSVASCSEIK